MQQQPFPFESPQGGFHQPYHQQWQFPPQPGPHQASSIALVLSRLAVGIPNSIYYHTIPHKKFRLISIICFSTLQGNRFSRLNKSTSLHDLAHVQDQCIGFPGGSSVGGGHQDVVPWEDQQQWSTTQSAIQGPTRSGLLHGRGEEGFKRTGSTRSLHQVQHVH